MVLTIQSMNISLTRKMEARELLAKLTHVTLVGFEDGEYQWIGTGTEWEKVEKHIVDSFK